MKLECKRCGKKWDYKGNNPYYASCPRCKTSVPVRKLKGGKR